MSRNGSGSYSVPNTFVAGTTISASDHNENWADLATELTNSVAADGQTPMTGALKLASGTLSAPSLTFNSDSDSGLYRKGGNNVALVLGGTEYVDFATATTAFANSVSIGGRLAASATAAFGGQVTIAATASCASDVTVTGIIKSSSTSHTQVASGTTAQRPGSPAAGYVRHNSTTGHLEAYTGAAWEAAYVSRLSAVRYYTSSDTWSKPSDIDFVIVEVVGPGGGGAGGAGNISGSGGGAGGFSRKRIAAASLGSTETVTVGTGGAGGVGNSAGSNGSGASSFGSHCTANSGSGGGAGSAFGSGGSASGGDLNLAGGEGSAGANIASLPGGVGGTPALYGAAGAGGASGANGRNGSGRGGGGGAGGATGGSSTTGGSGADGLVVVYEFTKS